MDYKRIVQRIVMTGLLLAMVPTVINAQTTLIEEETEQKVEELLSKMTLEEKVGQMNLHSSSWDVTGPAPESGRSQERFELLRSGGVGGMLNVIGAEATMEAQKIAVEESRLGIPLIFGYDVVHGYKTIFPIPLGEAASWDPELAERSARVAAVEAASAGLTWTFAPMVDVGRDPRWGRVMEGSGEDPYLGSQFAVARVKGFQTDDLSALNSIVATAKHFAAYAFAEGGRDYNTAEISDNTLHNVVLPPFKAAEEAGVGTFMNAFNDVNGIPASADAYLQRDILKGEWDFKGFMVSDWASIEEMIFHGYSKDLATAAAQAVEAGSDMDMESEAYQRHLVELVRNGEVDEALVDDAVRRILRIKFQLGLFEDPYRYSDPQREEATLLADEHRALAREVAQRSIVMLNNENEVLPLDKKIETIAVIGDLADDKDSPIANWRAQGETNSAVSLLEGIRNVAGSDVNVEFAQGYILDSEVKNFAIELQFVEDDKSGFPEAIELAKNADAVVVAVGELAFQSGEGRAKTDISLKGKQLDLLKELRKVNDNIIVVLMAGRPITEPWMYENMPAVLNTWHLGTEAGNAIADVIFGDYNPSAKLPLTIPRNVGQIPIYYNYKSTGRPVPRGNDYRMVFWSHYIDDPSTLQYPFGYGLSYSEFEYSDLTISSDEMDMDGAITVSVDVTNTGDVDGEEVVQLYIHDHFASTVRPVKELKGFEKVMLKAGETKSITFEITSETLEFYGADRTWKAEPGMFSVMVGPHSEDLQELELELK